MPVKNTTEVWLRGPLDNTLPLLQPVAHALMQAREEVEGIMEDFPGALLWSKPAGLASPGFHLQHLTGVLDRLFTYANGEQLTEEQLNALSLEGQVNYANSSRDLLLEKFNKQVDKALAELSAADQTLLTAKREVGRGRLPSTVIGLYVHAAEHTMRHVGQLIVTVNILQAQVNNTLIQH